MILIFDNYYENPKELIKQIKNLEFQTVIDPSSGVEYPNIAEGYGIGLHKVEQVLKQRLIYRHRAFYRKYDSKTKQPTYIHTDAALGDYTVILYLSDKSNGTAFWKHKETNNNKFKANELKIEQIQSIAKDTFDESKWELEQVVESKFNRLVIFDSKLYHSIYPKQVRGKKERVILVGFVEKW